MFETRVAYALAPPHSLTIAANVGGTQETIRVGKGLLEFGDSTVKYDGQTILSGPTVGSYQLFFYANGFLCFYHVNRGERGYRAYQHDEDGFSKLYACRSTPGEKEVDLAQAVVLTLPVVGETTFAWGQLGQQVVTGSNIGDFYVLEGGRWRKMLEPNLKVSYQLYSTMSFHDRLLMGSTRRADSSSTTAERLPIRPAGRRFSQVSRRVLARLKQLSFTVASRWSACGPGANCGAINRTRNWSFVRRMFDHPQLSDQIVHPYDVENRGLATPSTAASLENDARSLFDRWPDRASAVRPARCRSVFVPVPRRNTREQVVVRHVTFVALTQFENQAIS